MAGFGVWSHYLDEIIRHYAFYTSGVFVIAGLITSHLPIMRALHYTSKRAMISHERPVHPDYHNTDASFCPNNIALNCRITPSPQPLLSYSHTPASTSSLNGLKLAHVHLHHASSTCRTHPHLCPCSPLKRSDGWLGAGGRSALGGIGVHDHLLPLLTRSQISAQHPDTLLHTHASWWLNSSLMCFISVSPRCFS